MDWDQLMDDPRDVVRPHERSVGDTLTVGVLEHGDGRMDPPSLLIADDAMDLEAARRFAENVAQAVAFMTELAAESGTAR